MLQKLHTSSRVGILEETSRVTKIPTLEEIDKCCSITRTFEYWLSSVGAWSNQPFYVSLNVWSQTTGIGVVYIRTNSTISENVSYISIKLQK